MGTTQQRVSYQGRSITRMERFIQDKSYKNKVLQSGWMMWTFFVFGWQSLQFGPSLLDLQAITRVSLEEASWFVSIWMLGILSGSSLCGLVFDRMDKYLFVGLVHVLMALVIAAIPWCSIYEGMLAAQLIRGICTGLTDPAIHAILFFLWGPDGKSLLQGIHFAFAFGGILSPLATAPFLLPKDTPLPSELNRTLANSTDATYSEITPWSGNQSGFYEINMPSINHNMTSHIDAMPSLKESRLYVAYSITSGLEIITAIPYFLYFLSTGNANSDGKSSDSNRPPERKTRPLPRQALVVVLVVVALFMSMYRGIESIFSTFLPAILVKQMEWSKENGSFIISVIWGSLCLGRLVGIFLVRVISHQRIVLGYCLILLCSFIGLYACVVIESNGGIWAFALTAGYGFSITFPTAMSWIDELLVAVTGKMSSFIITVATVFSMINPIFLGVLIDQESPMWFFYTILGETMSLIVLFFIMWSLTKYICNKYGSVYQVGTDDNADDTAVEMKAFLGKQAD